MIDFRYHLVTIIAIFLALAVGIVVGTTALNGPVLNGLRDRNAGLISEKRALQSDVRDLQTDLDTADEFARALSPDLMAGRLSGQRVLLVTIPGTDGGTVDQLTSRLTTAGATVTGRLALQETLLDPASRQLVEDLVASVVPAGVELPEGSAVERAATELAAALLVPPGQEPLERTAAQEIVSAFEEAELAELSDAGETLTPATLVVVVAAPVGEERAEDEAERTEALLDVVAQLAGRSAGTVVAGPTEALLEGGLLRAVRGDGELDDRVSSVDNADRVVGQVAVVLALHEQLEGGVGRYGSGAGAQAPVPGAERSSPSSPSAPEPGQDERQPAPDAGEPASAR